VTSSFSGSLRVGSNRKKASLRLGLRQTAVTGSPTGPGRSPEPAQTGAGKQQA
jgi:hypothetical protein